MIAVNNFIIALILSFAGSIPPGTINLTVVQLGLESKVRTAIRFSVAASLVEYPYAWIAVKFEKLITSSPVITDNIQIISIIVLIVLGVIGVWPSRKNSSAAPPRFRACAGRAAGCRRSDTRLRARTPKATSPSPAQHEAGPRFARSTTERRHH